VIPVNPIPSVIGTRRQMEVVQGAGRVGAGVLVADEVAVPSSGADSESVSTETVAWLPPATNMPVASILRVSRKSRHIVLVILSLSFAANDLLRD
jgi:hypothetical protein